MFTINLNKFLSHLHEEASLFTIAPVVLTSSKGIRWESRAGETLNYCCFLSGKLVWAVRIDIHILRQWRPNNTLSVIGPAPNMMHLNVPLPICLCSDFRRRHSHQPVTMKLICGERLGLEENSPFSAHILESH
ncbi:hypothetical protein K1719_025814 [Acacia pycnantha]|nr:hypothetical protein K1719_025814 [Acacia pycnantha]